MKRESKSCGNCAFLEPAPCNDCSQGHTKWKAGTSLMLSEVRRLRGWLRYLLQQHGDSGTVRDGFVVGDCLNALSGKPSPKVKS